MDPLALLICAAVALAAAWVVAQPILAGSTAGAEGGVSAEDPAHLLRIERDILYQAIHELDLDYAAGKLSEADYRGLRAKQEAQAVAILKAIDAATAPARKPSSKARTRKK
jgi:hypothetical protein